MNAAKEKAIRAAADLRARLEATMKAYVGTPLTEARRDELVRIVAAQARGLYPNLDAQVKIVQPTAVEKVLDTVEHGRDPSENEISLELTITERAPREHIEITVRIPDGDV